MWCSLAVLGSPWQPQSRISPAKPSPRAAEDSHPGRALKTSSDQSSQGEKPFSISWVIFYKGLWKNRNMKEALCHQGFLPFEPFHCLASISSAELISLEFSPSCKCLLDLLLGQDPSALLLKDDALWFNTPFLDFSLPPPLLCSSGVSWPAVILYSSCYCSSEIRLGSCHCLLFSVKTSSSGSSPLFALWNVSGVPGECGFKWAVAGC